MAGKTQWALVKTGSSYASGSELPVTFGLGVQAKVEALRVTWPGGRIDAIGSVAANQFVTVQEGKGIVAATPIKRP